MLFMRSFTLCKVAAGWAAVVLIGLMAFLAGAGVAVLIYTPSVAGWLLLVTGAALTIVFAALATLAAVITRDKARGIGISILLWFYFSLLYDGLVLFILFQFSDYPLEKPSIVLSSLNPIDLARTLILLQLDASAMMGYTGAVFRSFFGSVPGILYSMTVLLLWMFTPVWLAVRKFNRKDL